MTLFLSGIYGLLMALLVYFMTGITIYALARRKAVPILLVLAKYFIYWKIVKFGFSRFSSGEILLGFTLGIYLGLPILYYLNKKWNNKK